MTRSPSITRMTRAALLAKRHKAARKHPATHFRAPISTLPHAARTRRGPCGASARWFRGPALPPKSEGAST